MCGIAGEWKWDGSKPDEALVREMCSRMIHRGPDDEGIVCLENIALGHRRLSIIDLSQRAHQPMASSDNRYHIVYNGEVYNFREIRDELKKAGVNFRSESDTEVVLYSYAEWGPACLNKFNGMFAFAIWDDKSKELFLARDRFGKKPLYYHLDPGSIAFASELSALSCDKRIARDISYEALNCYLALGYILSPLTIYKDMFKLEPASYMLIGNSGKNIKKRRYWNYADSFRTKRLDGEKELAGNILELLKSSVRKRMISDVPLGAFLSGGIDSSSVACLARRYHDGDMHTFSIGFEEKSYNELADADRAASFIGTIHHNGICKAGGALELLNLAIDAYDEPFADNSLIPTVELAKFTSSYVKVALSGDGADEIFAGYITYKADRYYKYAKLIPRLIRKMLIGLSDQGVPASRKKVGFRYRQKQFLYGTLFPAERAHYSWRLIFNPEERIAILGEEHKDLVYDTDPYFIFEKYYNSVKDLRWLDRHLYVDAMTWLTDDILVKVDRASMRSSLEVRCPYLDVELVNYAASVPAELKMKGLTTKYILKRSLFGVLPGYIINKKKSGFNAPTGVWLKTSGGLDEFRAFNKYVFDRKVKRTA